MNCSKLSRASAVPIVLLSCLFSIAASVRAQQGTVQPGSPTGHWIAEHPSNGGIGSWWDFRADGTLTMHFGVAVTSTITRSGDTYLAPPDTVGGKPLKITVHIDGDTLRLTAPDVPAQTFTRIGAVVQPGDPLLGRWKLVPAAAPSTDAMAVAQQKAMANAIYTFSADNTESIRIPFGSFEGVWDATGVFHLKDQTQAFSFRREGPKLVLGQPPDGKQTDTYLPDLIQ